MDNIFNELRVAKGLIVSAIEEKHDDWEDKGPAPGEKEKRIWKNKSTGEVRIQIERPGTPSIKEVTHNLSVGEHLGDNIHKFNGTPEQFKEALTKIAKTHQFSTSVEIKDNYEKDWKYFTSKGGDAVFAITSSGDIVSVAKDRNSTERAWGTRAVMIAKKHGGTKLDCFEVVLPEMYAKAGMRPIARLKFDDNYAPVGWDYEKYKAFNNGRPDVIFMAKDDTYTTYNPKDAAEVSSMEEAEKLREEFLSKSKKIKASGNGDLSKLEETIAKEVMKNRKISYEKAIELVKSF